MALLSLLACDPASQHHAAGARVAAEGRPAGSSGARADATGGGPAREGSGGNGGRALRTTSGGATVSLRFPEAGAAGGTFVSPSVCEPFGDVSAERTRIAVFGDYGSGPGTQRVSELVKSWAVDFILTAGDNNYPVGAAETIDENIGRFYAEFICPYRGRFGPGARKNRFFPALGNHDWYTAFAEPYLEYFSLPGNERYYDVVWGPVHAFVLDSDPSEPDGVLPDSVQATWLAARLAASTSRWKIVVMHHPPFSSGSHGGSPYMEWPFKAWGVHLVMAGHDHDYERIDVDGVTHIVSGLGGINTYGFNTTISGSRSRFNSDYGAGLLEADARHLVFRFFSVDNQLIDAITLGEP
jgi:hypothetical protein